MIRWCARQSAADTNLNPKPTLDLGSEGSQGSQGSQGLQPRCQWCYSVGLSNGTEGAKHAGRCLILLHSKLLPEYVRKTGTLLGQLVPVESRARTQTKHKPDFAPSQLLLSFFPGAACTACVVTSPPNLPHIPRPKMLCSLETL